MSNPFTIRPSLPGDAGAPYPFNSNDALVWKALICKYICKNKIVTFNKDAFYETFLAGQLDVGDAYISPLQNGSTEDRKLFDKLLYFSLDKLTEIGLLNKNTKNSSNVEYTKSDRLDIFCEDMLMYGMFDVNWMVEPVWRAQTEILRDQYSTQIIALLKELRTVDSIDANDLSKRFDPTTIQKLSQLGIILTPLEGPVKMTSVGKKVYLTIIRDLNF